MRTRVSIGVLLVAALLGGCSAGPPDGEPVDTTPASLVWVLSDLLDAAPSEVDVSEDTDSIQGSMSPANGSTMRIGLRHASPSDSTSVSCSGKEAPDRCAEIDGAVVTWDLVEPEEDPGLINIALPKDGSVAYLSYNGESITKNPLEMTTLPYSVEQMIAVLKDPRVSWSTTQEAVDGGEALISHGDGASALTPQALVHLYAEATGSTIREATGKATTDDGLRSVEAELWTEEDEYVSLQVDETDSARAYAVQQTCDQRFLASGSPYAQDEFSFDDCTSFEGTTLYWDATESAAEPGHLQMVLGKNHDTLVQFDYVGVRATDSDGNLNPKIPLARFAALVKDPRLALETSADVIADSADIELVDDVPDPAEWIY